ncbi:jg22411, partial [Pararge aegeria aegeria]
MLFSVVVEPFETELVLDEMVISSNKYEVVNTVISSFESRMALTVRKLSSADVGGYRCVAKNSLGEVDSIIRLYEIPGPSVKNTSPALKNEDFKYSTPIEGPDNQFGSAESSDDEDDKEADSDLNTRTNKFSLTNDNSTHKNKTILLNTTNLIKQNL